jgi:hypothetical protein
MTRDVWFEVMARLAEVPPTDLDHILAPETGAAQTPVPPTIAAPAVPPSPLLWDREEGVSWIGVRVDRPPRDVRATALRLAAAAAERRVVPVILSALPRTGFEQFGFRVERLPDGPPEAVAAFEAELCAFWDMPLVLALEDIEGLS